LGRISAAVAALCLAGAIQHAEDIYAMANPVDLDGTELQGGIQVLLEDFRGITGEKLPFAAGTLPDLGKLKCATDTRLQRRLCASRQPSDSMFAAIATTHRSTNGVTQLALDWTTTDTIVTRAALVRHNTDRRGHSSDFTWRSTQRWDGISWGSASMTLNGADTVFSTSGDSRSIGIAVYSDVRLARHPGFSSRNYPTSGIIHMTTTDEQVTSKGTRPSHSSIIVYFDGTSKPDAWLDGKRFHLNLDTGRATPYRNN
jgi:hypothetical protein